MAFSNGSCKMMFGDLVRHGRIYSGHPRLGGISASKAWMAGTSPAMTK